MIALARLDVSGLIEVPRAAAVTTRAYKLFVKEHKLDHDLNILLSQQFDDLENRLVGIRERFMKVTNLVVKLKT
jgi:phosphoenolpyruvate synthase/pyruvate phosphate dikinase